MALPSFTGLSPAATRGAILHISDATLPVAIVYTGAGVATCLAFTTDGISINGIPVYPATCLKLTADVVATDTNAVALTELNFTPVAGAMYDVDAVLLCTAASANGAFQLVNTSGVGALVMGPSNSAYAIASTGDVSDPPTSPIVGTFVLNMRGTFSAASTTALGFSIKSDDTNDVTALAGSHITYTRI